MALFMKFHGIKLGIGLIIHEIYMGLIDYNGV